MIYVYGCTYVHVSITNHASSPRIFLAGRRDHAQQVPDTMDQDQT